MSRRVVPAAWISLTTLGLAGGLIAGLIVGMPLGELVNAMITTAAVTCLVGAVLGCSQAFALRSVLRRPFWWVLGTTAGLGIGLAAGVVTVEQLGILATGVRPNVARLGVLPRAISFVTLGLVAGSVLGVAQSFVLRAQAPRIHHWIRSTSSGLAFALCASSLALDAVKIRLGSGLGVAMFVVAAGLMFGLATSRPLLRLPQPQSGV
jgi:hypothetical protein